VLTSNNARQAVCIAIDQPVLCATSSKLDSRIKATPFLFSSKVSANNCLNSLFEIAANGNLDAQNRQHKDTVWETYGIGFTSSTSSGRRSPSSSSSCSKGSVKAFQYAERERYSVSDTMCRPYLDSQSRNCRLPCRGGYRTPLASP